MINVGSENCRGFFRLQFHNSVESRSCRYKTPQRVLPGDIILEKENQDLCEKVEDLQRLLHESQYTQDQENQDLLNLQDKLGSKVTELYELHEQIVSTIKKESNS